MKNEVFLNQLLADAPSAIHPALLILVARIEALEDELAKKANAEVKPNITKLNG